MGYVIKIGNAIPCVDENSVLGWTVEDSCHEECPTFFGDSNKGNTRSPSYIVWGDFCEALGLESLFYIDSKPKGVIYLTEKHLEQVSQSLAAYKSKVKIPPGFQGVDERTHPAISEYDGYLARLIWLEWWIKWAISNCKTPALSIF